MHEARTVGFAFLSAQKKLPESTGPRGAKDSYLFRERLVGRQPYVHAVVATPPVSHVSPEQLVSVHASPSLGGPQSDTFVPSRCRPCHAANVLYLFGLDRRDLELAAPTSLSLG